MFKKSAMIIAATSIVFTGSVTALAADTKTSDISTEFQGGSLELSGAPIVGGFGDIQLDGTKLDKLSSLEGFTITDATGTGSGWTVELSASQFENELEGRQLTSTLNLQGGVHLEAGEGSSDLDTISKPDGVEAMNFFDGIILSAGVNGGMGQYTVSFDEDALNLKVDPKDAFAGTYKSTITVELTSGPQSQVE